MRRMSVVRWSDPFTKIIQVIRSPSIYALRESFWQRDSVKRTKQSSDLTMSTGMLDLRRTT